MSASSRTLSLALTLGVSACASGGGMDSSPDLGPTSPPAQAARAPVATPPPPMDAAAGVFTAAQADGGRDTFRSQCTECHFSGEFADAQFKFKWSRRSAGDLFEMIGTQMPETAPGSLTPDETAGLVSYILRMNGFEEGERELPADAEALASIPLGSIRN